MSQAHLVVMTGPRKGDRVAIDDSLTIGRDCSNGLWLNEPEVSSEHVVIERTPKGIMLRDVGSTNGTFVGMRRVVHCELSHGDVIRIGLVDLRYEAPGVPPRPVERSTTPVRYVDEADTKIETHKAQDLYRAFRESPSEASSFGELQQLQQRLMALYDANHLIASERDLTKLFDHVGEQVLALTRADDLVILLRDERTGELVDEHVKSRVDNAEVTVSRTIADRAMANSEAIITRNASEDSRFLDVKSVKMQNITSAMCVPLTHHDEPLGALYVDAREVTGAFTQSDLEMLVALADPTATAIKNAQVLRKLERSYRDTLVGLANTIELRDHYTVGHTWRVTQFAVAMARELGWPDKKLKECETGGVLHDIGKIAVDDAILRKTGPLTNEEWQVMRIHPQRGAAMLQDIESLTPVIPYVLHHHERYDGSTEEPHPGYPYGLKEENIPIEGRLISVADALDALTSNRSYRDPVDPDRAIDILKKDRGTREDPVCVDALVRCYEEGRIQHILQQFLKTDEKSIACPFCSTYIAIPESVAVGQDFDCLVCHRRVRIRKEASSFRGELVPGAGALRV